MRRIISSTAHVFGLNRHKIKRIIFYGWIFSVIFVFMVSLHVFQGTLPIPVPATKLINNMGTLEMQYMSLETSRITYDGQATPESSRKNKSVKFILLLANAGRSGSTLFSEVLATEKESVLFFEPLFENRTLPCVLNGTCINDFFEDIFKCDYSSEFERYFRSKRMFNNYYHPSVKRCHSSRNHTECLQNLNIRQLCQNATIRIIKVIRAKLINVESLLRNPTLNLKVIFLQRDPRATYASRYKMGWDKTPLSLCTKQLQNNEVYDDFLLQYPSQLDQVKHEEFSKDPFQTLERIYSFLYDNSTLPDIIEQYIESHMLLNKSARGVMSTIIESKKEYQAWRWEITENLLLQTEKEPVCNEMIKRYGHNIFGSMKRLLDPNIPLEID